jgi:hypothetical protein
VNQGDGWMSGETSFERKERAARNETLFRSVNEELKDLAASFQHVSNESPYTCECSDSECIERLWLSMDEYEAIRAVPNHFAVLPGHVDRELETVVRETDRYVVVAKIGEAAAIADETDPRT